jgi:hypothetical protein
MNRKERRAAEHAARKAARKAGFPTTTAAANPANDSAAIAAAPIPQIEEDNHIPASKPPISAARLAANRQNAKLSTGPTSEAGLLKVSTNAVKTALTGRTVLLPFDNTEAYQALLTSYQKEFAPVGPVECGLAQSLVDTCWCLERIPGLEYALLESGYNQLGNTNQEATLNTPESALELKIRLIHEKTFHNLHIQENRLTRRRDREMKELRTLQDTRKAKEAEELKIASEAALVAEHNSQPFQLEDLGFEISTQRFATYMARLTPGAKQNILKEALVQATTTTAAA